MCTGNKDLLQREADDLCGHRGLIPGSDHQTFSMTLPTKLRNYYDKATPDTSLLNTTGFGDLWGECYCREGKL